MDYININNSIERDLEFLSDFREEGLNSATWAIETMKKLRLNANVYEKKLAEFLFSRNVNYYTQVPFKIIEGGRRHVFFADFYIPELQAIIEVDGESHEGADAEQRDSKRDELFWRIGISTIRVKNKDIKDGRFDIIPIPNSAHTEKRAIETKMKLLLLSKTVIEREEDDLIAKRIKKEEDQRKKQDEEAKRKAIIIEKRQRAPLVVSESIGTDYFMTFFIGAYNGGDCAYFGVNVFKIVQGSKKSVFQSFNTIWIGKDNPIPKTKVHGIPLLTAISTGLSKLPTSCSVAVSFADLNHRMTVPREMLYRLFVGVDTHSQWLIYKNDVGLLLTSNKLKRIVACSGFEKMDGEDRCSPEASFSKLFWEDDSFGNACKKFKAEIQRTKPIPRTA